MSLRGFILLVLFLTGIVWLQWLWISPPGAVKPVRLTDESWIMPEQPGFNVKESLVTLTNASLWGKLAENAQPAPLNDPEWRFLGAMTREQERYVIIRIEGQPEQKLMVGDTLPGGSQILGINTDRLCVLVAGQKRSLPIYPQGLLGGSMPAVEAVPASENPAKRAGPRKS